MEMQPGDVVRTYADTSDLEKAIDFKPSTSIEEGLEKFAKWYKEFYNIEIEDKELEKALVGMKEVGIIDDSIKLVDKNILLMDPAYVHIEEEKKVADVMKEFEKDNIYMLGRYGRWTYNCMEDCVQLADDLASRLNDE